MSRAITDLLDPAPALEELPCFLAAGTAELDPLTGACREMMSGALDFCRQKTRAAGHAAVAHALRAGNRAAHDYFRYGLAREIGSYLGNAEATVKTVYLFEPNGLPGEIVEEEPDIRVKGLHLIAWVAEQPNLLASLVDGIDTVLLEEYRTLVGPAAEQMGSFLTVDVIDDGDVERRAGSGALVASLYTRPIKVWSRYVIRLNPEFCGRCHICSTICPYGAITISPGATAAKIDLDKCQLCGLCYSACPAGAIESAYYDFAALARDVQSSVRANGHRSIALTCLGSTPTAEEIEEILGEPGFTPICLPCVGRTPPEFFLKALTMGIERIAILPCQDDHCRFRDGSRIIRNRIMLLRPLLKQLNYDPNLLLFREAQGPLVTVNPELCTGCGACIGICPYEAIRPEAKGEGVLFVARVDPALCQGCGLCVAGCPSRAIEMSRFGNAEMIGQIQAALATPPLNEGPRIVGFRCNWCSYGDSDLPFDRLHDSGHNIEVIRVPCVGRIDPLHVLFAFLSGADGVYLGGCSPNTCRYNAGGSQAEQRINALHTLMAAHGLEPWRLRLEWLRRDIPGAFGSTIRAFAQEIRQGSPSSD